MNFETITADDLKNITHLQPEGWSDIIPEFEFYVQSPICNTLMKKTDNKIIGIGASIIFKNSAWIAHIIVDNDHRRKGIGYKITEDLLIDIDKKSIKSSILIATDLGKPIYEKLGFRTISRYLFFKRENQDNKYKISENICNFKSEHYQLIIDLDRKITGEDREILLKKNIRDSKVFIENNKIEGFYVPGFGEGPIIAVNEYAGIELMKLKHLSSDYAVIPEENSAGIKFLTENGFSRQDKIGTRMVRNIDVDWKPEFVFSRIGGNFG